MSLEIQPPSVTPLRTKIKNKLGGYKPRINTDKTIRGRISLQNTKMTPWGW